MLSNVFKNEYIHFNFSKFSGGVPDPLVNSAGSQPRIVLLRSAGFTPPPPPKKQKNLNARHFYHSSHLNYMMTKD